MRPKSIQQVETDRAWDRAVANKDLDIWIEHLDRLEVDDCLEYAVTKAREASGADKDLTAWISASERGPALMQDLLSPGATTIEGVLAEATVLRWQGLLESLIRDCPDRTLPSKGVLQYFSQGLGNVVLMEYRRTGSAVELSGTLVIPSPTAFADPVRALQYAETGSQLGLLRRSLYSSHKVLAQRNILIHVDRDESEDVFGPSIDTLLLNDWLFETRYLLQRRSEDNMLYHEPALPKEATRLSAESGNSFLEIGCGNGLLTATFAKNEARVRRFAAIDISMAAIMTTFRNSARQRLLHRGQIGDRGRFIVSTYNLDAVPLANDLVVCNPPYIPEPPGWNPGHRRRLAAATIGTSLLRQVVSDAPQLIRPGGTMALVMSELAEQELFDSMPPSMTVQKMRSLQVPLRLDSLDETHDRDILDWLAAERGLIIRADQNGGYDHVVSVYEIHHGADNV